MDGPTGRTDPSERRRGEHDFNRDLEVLRDLQREVEARAVLATLEVADRLIVNANRVGELPTRDSPLGAEHGNPVVDGLTHTISRCAV